VKVASFNVNSIRARLGIVLEWMEKNSPEVLCLQETKAEDADFPKCAFEDINYHTVYHGEKSYNGVAIVSKLPLKDVRVGFDEDGAEGTRLVSARIDNIPVVNTYVPQGFHPLSEKFRYKLDWLERLYNYFDKNFRPERPLLWLGDFNVAPEEKDVYDPEHLLGQVGFHPDEHTSLERFKKWGFVDVFRMHESSSGQYTFWDYRLKNAVKRRLGWRVDHIWATRPLSKKSTRAWIDIEPRLCERPSDHTFIVAEFDLKK
jgi:exodeoxyribonuclease-3